jgi:hypothetical protein
MSLKKKDLKKTPGLRPRVSKPFFLLPCCSHPLQFLCTCGSSIAAHCHLFLLSLSLSPASFFLLTAKKNFLVVDLFSRSGTTFWEDYLVEKVGIFFPFFSTRAFGFSSHGRLLHRARERCVYREVERF